MTATSVRHHLVAVWNPSYVRTAMDEHLTVLLRWAERYDRSEATDDELYVWWGKVRSSNRQRPQANVPGIRAAAEASRTGAEVHLYLTDYRSLYVGEVIGVIDQLSAAELAHAPAYYGENDLKCDFWFKLGDIRRIVADDTLLVIDELKKLRNVHYNDRPVSIYGGMVDLPLVVTRADAYRFFDQDERDRLTDGQLWAEFDAGSGSGLGAMERDLRENCFGDSLWLALDPAARTFIATAERIYREHRGDAAFDFAPVMTSFAKAIEVQANVILRRALPKLTKGARLVNLDGRTVDLAEHRALGLGELARAIGAERELNEGLAAILRPNRWFVESFPAVVIAFKDVRNPGAHAELIDRATATRWRERLVGVGCEGDLVKLAAVRI